MNRPAGLPEFTSPPVNEVVVGIQFDQPLGYQNILAADVWRLFQPQFPAVSEQSPLPPAFEIFGPRKNVHMNFGMFGNIGQKRYWFASDEGYELIQFQSDRFLHNWRKIAGKDNEYPRFESIIAKYAAELDKFSLFCERLHPQQLVVRQCEISYINHIRSEPGPIRAADWLNFVSFGSQEPDDFVATFRRTIMSGDGQPRGRLICESATTVDPEGKEFISLTLTVRGPPDTPARESALEFLDQGREMIVRTFAEITTDSAQKIWGRTP